jgi:hypothetical protein
VSRRNMTISKPLVNFSYNVAYGLVFSSKYRIGYMQL